MDEHRQRLLDLLKAQGCSCHQGDSQAERSARLRGIAARAGGVNRLAVLLRFHQAQHTQGQHIQDQHTQDQHTQDQHTQDQHTPLDPSDN